MKTVEIRCDACDRDLTSTGNCEGYRVVLENERIPPRGGVVTAMAAYPSLDRSKHFCRLECLDYWRDHERLYAKLRKEKSDQWAEEKGTKIDGRIRSYPCPSQAILEAWDSDCRSEATLTFPLPRP